MNNLRPSMPESVRVQIIEQQANKVLNKQSNNTSMFSWLMSLSMHNATNYNAQNSHIEEHDYSYLSIMQSLPPKTSFYAESKHYQQYTKDSTNLASVKNPQLFISLSNLLHPQSLSCTKNEQELPFEVLENCTYETQTQFKRDLQNENREYLHKFESTNSSFNSLPENKFVDDIFDAINF